MFVIFVPHVQEIFILPHDWRVRFLHQCPKSMLRVSVLATQGPGGMGWCGGVPERGSWFRGRDISFTWCVIQNSPRQTRESTSAYVNNEEIY